MFITKANLLDLIESAGREIAGQANPGYWAYEDRDRAKAYVPALEALRGAWKAINEGEDPLTVLERMKDVRHAYSNGIGLVMDGIGGRWEQNEEWFRNLPKGIHWVTYEGDFYCISAGDKLNLPCVTRYANNYLPKEKQNIEGSKKIAAMIPNPCTRVKMPVQVR